MKKKFITSGPGHDLTSRYARGRSVYHVKENSLKRSYCLRQNLHMQYYLHGLLIPLKVT